MKILITGVCGFIFSNFMHYVLDKRPDYSFVGLDNCDEKLNIKNILPNTDRYKFYLVDVRQENIIDNIFDIEKPDIVIHGCAQSFVDSSIENPLRFITTNIVGTQNLVNAAVKYKVKNFFYISSDEVYGSLNIGDKSWVETDQTLPSSPYSSSKLGGEHIVRSASRTYGLNYNISRCCNIYGWNQQTRNLIPKIITSIMDNKPIALHDGGKPIREWMYVQDKIDAILTILESGKLNETYNIGSGIEKTNLEVYKIISELMGKSTSLDLSQKRLGQDFRYSVDCTKIKSLGWNPRFNFNASLESTINWYLNNYKS